MMGGSFPMTFASFGIQSLDIVLVLIAVCLVSPPQAVTDGVKGWCLSQPFSSPPPLPLSFLHALKKTRGYYGLGT